MQMGEKVKSVTELSFQIKIDCVIKSHIVMLHVEASGKIQLFFILLDIRSQILNIIYGLDHIYENTHIESYWYIC